MVVLVVGQRVYVAVLDGLDAVVPKVEVARVGQVKLVNEGEVGLVARWRWSPENYAYYFLGTLNLLGPSLTLDIPFFYSICLQRN